MSGVLAALRRHFRWVAIFSALANVLYLAPTLYMLQVYDRVVPTRGDLTLGFLTLVLLFALATLSLLELVRSRLLVRASIRLDRHLAGALIAATLARPNGIAGRTSRQPIREGDLLRQTLTGPAIFALFDAPWSPVYIAVCICIHPTIGALAVAGSSAILAVAWYGDRTTRQPLTRANIAANRSYASQEQSIAGAETIRALGMQDARVRLHLAEREEMLAYQAQASFAAGRQTAISRFLRNMLQSGALGLGALLAIDGKISAGAISASSFLLGRAVAPIDQIVANWRSIVQARAAYAEIAQWLDATPRHRPAIHLPRPAGRVDIEQAGVFDRASDRAILSNLSFAIAAGEMVAITGASGAGKSAVARLVAGAIACDVGRVRIDGAERAQWDDDALAAHIGYLPQKVTLFAGTIRDNIARFSAAGVDEDIDASVIAAARDCGVHGMILRLPAGYDTVLGADGAGLSMGQAQRIALARALFREPSILILDEPNAHLDADGAAQLMHALVRAKARGAAILLTAHRAGVLAPADRIMVLAGGRIQAIGPREEMLKTLTRPHQDAARRQVVVERTG
uniref:type I secretion system permease/ATPase n=1 Tax=uncultured Sphingomonas sp. TaxID=158754 RepID=UPI0035CAFC46